MRARRLVVVALPGVYPYELGVASRFFGAAILGGLPCYEVRTCSLDGGSVPTNSDFSVMVNADRTALAEADTILVPAWDGAFEGGDPIGLAQYRRQRVISYCTGAFTLAAAGLLDGRAATTHWSCAPMLAERYPGIEVRPDVLYVDEGKVLTAAGASAAIDLTLHVIASDFGASVAADVARTTLAPPHREGGQAQFIARRAPPSEPVSMIQQWLLERLDQPLSLDQVASEFGVSVRTLTRRFKAESSLTLGDWLVAARVDRAKELLETTSLGVEDLARSSGFVTSASLRKHFRDRVGLSPLRYRRAFVGQAMAS